MIKEITMYTILCDNCGKDACEDTEHSCWGEPSHAYDMACESWITEGKKHYCPDCYSYNDEDELEIKSINQPKP